MQHIVTVREKVFSSAISLVVLAILSACSPSTFEITASPSAYPISDYAKNMSECLAAEGWEVETHPDNSVTSNIPGAQQEAYYADHVSCVEKFGYDIEPSTPPTEEESREAYQKNLALRECLKKQGYDLGEPPSEQYYLDNRSKDAELDPYYTIDAPGKDRQVYYDLLAICPR